MFESKNYFYNVDVPLEDLGDGIKRKVLAYRESLMVVKVYFERVLKELCTIIRTNKLHMC